MAPLRYDAIYICIMPHCVISDYDVEYQTETQTKTMSPELPPFIEKNFKHAFDEIRDNITTMKSTDVCVSVDKIIACIISSPEDREEQWKLFCEQWKEIIRQFEGIAAKLRAIYAILPEGLPEILGNLLDEETKASLLIIHYKTHCLSSTAETIVLSNFQLLSYLAGKKDPNRTDEEWQNMIKKVVSFISK